LVYQNSEEVKNPFFHVGELIKHTVGSTDNCRGCVKHNNADPVIGDLRCWVAIAFCTVCCCIAVNENGVEPIG
jgi:hypothetical protein